MFSCEGSVALSLSVLFRFHTIISACHYCCPVAERHCPAFPFHSSFNVPSEQRTVESFAHFISRFRLLEVTAVTWSGTWKWFRRAEFQLQLFHWFPSRQFLFHHGGKSTPLIILLCSLVFCRDLLRQMMNWNKVICSSLCCINSLSSTRRQKPVRVWFVLMWN